MTKKIYLETFEKCPRSLHFSLLALSENQHIATVFRSNTLLVELSRNEFNLYSEQTWSSYSNFIPLFIIALPSTFVIFILFGVL